MKYKLIIFDFDGTLADSFPWFIESIGRVTERFGLRPIDASEFETMRDCSAREMIARCGLPFWKLPLIVRYMRTLMSEGAGRIGLFPGTEDLLKGLAERGVVSSIVTSNSEENVRRILGPASQFVRHFACGASVFGKAKHFRHVLKKTGISRDETLCIGDEIRDYDAARSEGLDFGAVSWGYTHATALAKLSPVAVFAELAEILALSDPPEPPRMETALPSALPAVPPP